MSFRGILSATQKGFAIATRREGDTGPASGIHRLLAVTQRGLGMRVATPIVEAKQAQTVAVGEASPTEASAAAPSPLSSIKVAFATGLYKTKAGVIGGRLLADNAEPLRTYLTVQLRGAAPARAALAAIEDALDHGSGDQFKKGPSQRAALYLAARNHVEYERLFADGPAAPLSAVPWEPTPPGKIEGWGRALDEMRFGLGDAEAELLLLHHVSGLNEAELAYVLGTDKSEVARKIEAGLGFAKLLLEDIFEDDLPDLAPILKDAFDVIDPTPEELAATASPKAVPLPAGTLLGDRYEIEGTLGGGEFAHVYRARDVRVPGHIVALKLLHRVARTPAAREGAMRELSLIASAFHPSLVQFKDHGWYEERLWFVMPFYVGEMLLDRIGRGPLDLEDALAHFERLARGLAALHAAGIRHQDVKPENIFLVEMQNEVLPILLDLGVASPNGEMALAGTPMYFPPEVAGRIIDEHCELPLTPKADVFALSLSLLHSIEEPDLSDLVDVEVDAFLQNRMRAAPRGPRKKEHAFLVAPFARWLAGHPKDRPTAMQLADEIAELRRTRAGRGTRRALVAPNDLRTLLVAVAMGTILLTCALVVDTPARPIEVVQSGTAAAVEAAPVGETDALRLLRARLDTEERRALELEEELSRARRGALGLTQDR